MNGQEKISNVVLSQQVSNPVGNGDNTDQGERLNAPSLVTSRSIALDQQVVNPVGSDLNTGRGRQEPLPMRPIPS